MSFRDYRAVLESDLYLGDPIRRAILSRIAYLTNGAKGCWAAEASLAHDLGVSVRTVQRSIQQLLEDQLISVQVTRDQHGHIHNRYFPDPAQIKDGKGSSHMTQESSGHMTQESSGHTTRETKPHDTGGKATRHGSHISSKRAVKISGISTAVVEAPESSAEKREENHPNLSADSAASTRNRVHSGRDSNCILCGPSDMLAVAGRSFRLPSQWRPQLRVRGTFPDSDEPREYVIKREDGTYVRGLANVYWQDDAWEVRDGETGERIIQ